MKKNRDKISLWKRKRNHIDVMEYIQRRLASPSVYEATSRTPLMDMLQKKSDSTLRVVSRQLGYDVD